MWKNKKAKKDSQNNKAPNKTKFMPKYDTIQTRGHLSQFSALSARLRSHCCKVCQQKIKEQR